jgi:hypothetical protein
MFVVSSVSLLITVMNRDERLTFWSFCVFEACVGMYWPSVGYLKGRVVEDGIRARVYGVLRVPLNIFVVVALSMTQEGQFITSHSIHHANGFFNSITGSEYRDTVFLTCSGMLAIVSGIVHATMTGRSAGKLRIS